MSKSLLDEVTRAGAKYLARKMVKLALPDDFPASERARLTESAATEIRAAVDLVRQRLKKATAAPPVDPSVYTVQWTKVLAACRVLNLKPPRQGRPVDAVKVKAHWRAAMAAYHPDKGPGHEAECAAATAARDVLDAYNEGLKVGKTEP